jgi:hypothetical protein
MACVSVVTACTSRERDSGARERPFHDATASQAAVESSVPDVIRQHLDSLALSITVDPVPLGASSDSETLRSLDLHTSSSLREPHALGPSGTPVSADAEITSAQAVSLLDILKQHRFFQQAVRCHSERRQNPEASPPPGSHAGLPLRKPGARGAIVVVVFDDDWYHYFVNDLDGTKSSRELLRDLAGPLNGPAASLLKRLIGQLPR